MKTKKQLDKMETRKDETMELTTDKDIQCMSTSELMYCAEKYLEEYIKLDDQREAEYLRLLAIENKMKNADDPTGEDFENLILLRNKQRKKIFAIANDANAYRRKWDNLNYEIGKRK